MVDTTKKGNRIQRYAKKYFESLGFTVHMAIRTSSKRGNIWISQNNDIFNAYDGIAVKLNEKPIFFQTTTKDNLSTKKEPSASVPIDTKYCEIYIMGYQGGRKRLDKRYKDKKYLPTHYFRTYRLIRLNSKGKDYVWQKLPDIDLKKFGVEVE